MQSAAQNMATAEHRLSGLLELSETATVSAMAALLLLMLSLLRMKLLPMVTFQQLA